MHTTIVLNLCACVCFSAVYNSVLITRGGDFFLNLAWTRTRQGVRNRACKGTIGMLLQCERWIIGWPTRRGEYMKIKGQLLRTRKWLHTRWKLEKRRLAFHKVPGSRACHVENESRTAVMIPSREGPFWPTKINCRVARTHDRGGEMEGFIYYWKIVYKEHVGQLYHSPVGTPTIITRHPVAHHHPRSSPSN